MSRAGSAIDTSDLTKVYGKHLTAVDRLNLSVRRGEVYGFLGPNGAGKTTTLRMLLGLVRATSGTARVLGEAPGYSENLARVGAMVEEPALYPYLSGRDNLRVIARYVGRPDDGIDAALDAVGLLQRGGDRFNAYSQGMRQRLGVAAALLKDPELLILDEPTNGLDPAGMADMRTLIRTLGSGDRTVLLSSHLLGEVQQVCDRVGVISHGALIAEGRVDELRGRGSILVRAEPLAAARERVERLLGAGHVEVLDGTLRLDSDPADSSRINRELVLAGIAVSEVRRVERTLEDVFLELTGEDPGDHAR
ncbi:MAG TPA: ABC transporter ATP-binding protein [Actinomycetota bacterium]|nr:ABC transporter ATP-binding protein [Actinomycetota bacterium]